MQPREETGQAPAACSRRPAPGAPAPSGPLRGPPGTREARRCFSKRVPPDPLRLTLGCSRRQKAPTVRGIWTSLARGDKGHRQHTEMYEEKGTLPLHRPTRSWQAAAPETPRHSVRNPVTGGGSPQRHKATFMVSPATAALLRAR